MLYFLFQDEMDGSEAHCSDELDIDNIREEDFEKYVTFIVPDVDVDPNAQDRAIASLPRSLTLKTSQALDDVSKFFIGTLKLFLHYKIVTICHSSIVRFPGVDLNIANFCLIGQQWCLEYRLHSERNKIWSSQRKKHR